MPTERNLDQQNAPEGKRIVYLVEQEAQDSRLIEVKRGQGKHAIRDTDESDHETDAEEH